VCKYREYDTSNIRDIVVTATYGNHSYQEYKLTSLIKLTCYLHITELKHVIQEQP
jgi:hypothetical protein